MANDDTEAGPLAEFTALRQEINSMQNFQQQVLTLQLTLSGAIFGFAVARDNLAELLLIIPVSSYMLCSRYVALGLQIGLCAEYVRQELSRRVSGGLGWEAWLARHRSAGRVLTVGWTVPLLMTFIGPALLALAWTFARLFVASLPLTPLQVGFALMWLLGAVAAGLATALLLRWDAPKAA